MPVAESTFFDPPFGVTIPRNDSGYNNAYKVIRSGQVVLLAVNPPARSEAGSSVYEFYKEDRSKRTINHFFQTKKDGTLWSHLDIVKRCRVKEGLTLSIRDSIENPFIWQSYVRIPLVNAAPAEAPVLQQLARLYFHGVERTNERMNVEIACGHPFGHVTSDGRNTSLDCLRQTRINGDTDDFAQLYKAIHQSPFITRLHGSAKTDIWDLKESTIDSEDAPFATWLAQEIGIYIHEKRCHVIEELRVLAPEILSRHSIAGLFLKEDPRTSSGKLMAEEAKKILIAVGLLSAENILQESVQDLMLLWVSPAVVAITLALLRLLGHQQLARGLQRQRGSIALPFGVLALGSALLEAELKSIRDIRQCQGYRMMETEALGALTADEMALYNKHRRLLEKVSNPRTVQRVSATLSDIEEAIDLDFNFVCNQ